MPEIKIALTRFNLYLSFDVASWSEITPCSKIDKPLVVYRFSGNVMMSIMLIVAFVMKQL